MRSFRFSDELIVILATIARRRNVTVTEVIRILATADFNNKS